MTMRMIVVLKLWGGPADGQNIDWPDNQPLPETVDLPIMAFGHESSFRVWTGCPESMRHAVTMYKRDGVTNRYLWVATTRD